MDVEGDVAHQGDYLGVDSHPLGVVGQVLSKFGRQGIEMGVQGVKVAVLVDQLGRRLLPHPGNAGEVVRRVAPQRGQQRVLGREHASPLFDAGFVVEGVVAHASPVVEHPDVGVLDQLVRIAVTGDDNDRVAPIAGFGCQGGQHIVGFEPFG